MSFGLNLLLALMKAILSYLSGSLAITASAIDSGTDAVASFAIFIGILLSGKKFRSFPMGLYKLENVAAVIIAIFIFIAGYEMMVRILQPAESTPTISPATIFLIFAGTVAAFLFGRFATAAGKKTESPTLIAEGRHRQVDVLASMVVLASITVSYFDVTIRFLGLSIDRIAAVPILFFIVKAGWELLLDGMRVLLDASIDADSLYRIRTIIDGHPKVDEIQSLIGRSAGRFRFIQGVITVKTKNLEEAQRIREEIETKVRDRVPHMEKIMIHCGPQVRTHELLALPLYDRQGRISAHFGEAPYFGFVRIGLKDKSVERMGIVENPHRSVETAKGIRVAEWLISQDVDHVGMKEDISLRGPGYVLSNAGVQTHRTHEETIDRATAAIVAEIV
ncbi:cation diffusion facilitator family transporter [uncultured Desulfosarcina sp.]|uniref:cation diffusion facilitator family transporter n=1 Tax=uncultured Desulfosarcina sp. TaxID=218289 RepID=UPI0029C6572F|nr:cation diffusion facilitator family transporter [uncultured Desulfosarcina sp.]